MATSAVYDHTVSSSTSDVPNFFAQNEDDTEVDAESDLENRPARKKRGKAISYLAEETFDTKDQTYQALLKF